MNLSADLKLTTISSNDVQLLITVQLFKQRWSKYVLIGISVNCYINNHYHWIVQVANNNTKGNKYIFGHGLNSQIVQELSIWHHIEFSARWTLLQTLWNVEKARNIVNILKHLRLWGNILFLLKTHKIKQKDALSNKKLNDTKTVKFSPENRLFYFADNSNSICENCKRLFIIVMHTRCCRGKVGQKFNF